IGALVDLSAGRLTLEEARRRWLLSPWVRAHEMGLCSPEAFAANIVSELDLAVTPDAFLREFMRWRKGPLPGAVALVEALAQKRLLACLSNMSALHWEMHLADPDSRALLAPMEHPFISSEMGLMKPDRAVFERVIRELAIEPESILFFDDNR